MEVSNTTGRNTNYRIFVSSPSDLHEERLAVAELIRGMVSPQDYAVEALPLGDSWTVEFLVDGKIVGRTFVDNPKVSVVLTVAENGKYQVQASVATVDAFITCSSGEEKWAMKLNAALRENGVSTWFGATKTVLGPEEKIALKKAIDEAKYIVVLVGPQRKVSERQRYEWMLALEALWRDDSKRLVPLLLKGVELPGFLRSTSSDRSFAVLRVDDPRRGWKKAVTELVKILKSEADLRRTGEIINTLEEDRCHQQEWLAYLGEVAENFREVSSEPNREDQANG